MHKIFFLLTTGFLSLSFSLFPVVKAGSKITAERTVNVTPAIASPEDEITADDLSGAFVAVLYDRLELAKLGLSFNVLQHAVKGYQHLLNKGAIQNANIVTVCDFSQSSKRKRMYILDVKNQKVLVNTYVAHGKNTGVEYAKSFSNANESLQSSLGFYVTKGTYFGKHGLSLKLEGKEPGFNDNAEQRAVVLHGADYIGSHRLSSAYMGRSFGCPAVPEAEKEKVISLIKNGTLLFIYHPTSSYLNGSRILNS
ncbi:MAG: murein L,D-transpeptidase catalytic domain family protein [Chitinophagaceae bacterium]